MAREVYEFAVTIPAGTPIATPQVTPMGTPPRVLDEVEVRVPPGPGGEVGFQLGMASKQLYPLTPGQWVVTDDEVVSFTIENAPDSGAWQLIAYNTGYYVHTLKIRLFMSLTPGEAALSGGPLPNSQLNG